LAGFACTIKPETFTPGVQAGAYLAAIARKDGKTLPLGTPDGTATVASDGSVAFTGLTYDADYVAMEVPKNEVRTLTVDATGGTFNLASGDESADLAFNISAANLKTAIVAALDVTSSDVTVTGGPGDSGGTTPYVITFVGALGKSPSVPALTVDGTLLTGGGHTASIALTTGGRVGGENIVRFHPVAA
jgi:hypothetical protein